MEKKELDCFRLTFSHDSGWLFWRLLWHWQTSCHRICIHRRGPFKKEMLCWRRRPCLENVALSLLRLRPTVSPSSFFLPILLLRCLLWLLFFPFSSFLWVFLSSLYLFLPSSFDSSSFFFFHSSFFRFFLFYQWFTPVVSETISMSFLQRF